MSLQRQGASYHLAFRALNQPRGETRRSGSSSQYSAAFPAFLGFALVGTSVLLANFSHDSAVKSGVSKYTIFTSLGCAGAICLFRSLYTWIRK